MKILDIGCGKKKYPAAIGIDRVFLEGVDKVWDLNVFPYPFESESFDLIVARHSLQHLHDIVLVMNEIHRLLKKDGIVKIYVPHYASDNYNTDPTHKTHFGYRSINYFCNNVNFHYTFYTDKYFRLVERYLSFRQIDDKSIFKNPFRLIGIEWLINKFPRIYERFLVYILPPSEIYFQLKK